MLQSQNVSCPLCSSSSLAKVISVMLSCYNKAVRYLKLHQFSLLSRDVVSCKFLSQPKCVSSQDLIKIQSVVLCISFRKSGHLCKKANLQKDTSEHGRDVSVKSLHCDQFCHTMFTIGHNCAKFGHRVNVKGQDLYRPPLAAVLCFLKVFFLQIPGKMCNCDQCKPVIWTGDKIYHFTKDQKP